MTLGATLISSQKNHKGTELQAIGVRTFRKVPADWGCLARLDLRTFSTSFIYSYEPRHVPAWIGGQGTLPNEQKTQQSPAWGFNKASHCRHLKKNIHESVGILSLWMWPQAGHVRIDLSTISCIFLPVAGLRSVLKLRKLVAQKFLCTSVSTASRRRIQISLSLQTLFQ